MRLLSSKRLNGSLARTVCFTGWFHRHNNPRYAELFPQLEHHVDFAKVVFSKNRILRGLEFRTWKLCCERFIYPQVLSRLMHKYDRLLTVDIRQVPFWSKPMVVDHDDPTFSDEEMQALNAPNVEMVVVTTERAKNLLESHGLRRPITVIPQGVMLEADGNKVREVSMLAKTPKAIVVGYHSPNITLPADGPRRPRKGQDDVDLLLNVLQELRPQIPDLVLWLIGEPSNAVRQCALKQPWIKTLGYIPLEDIPAYVRNFDIGVYPRAPLLPPGRFSVKIAQYMAAGLPIVSTDVDESHIIQVAKCGFVCRGHEEFASAISALARSRSLCKQLGQSARLYAETHLDWKILIPKYERLLC